MKFEEMYYVLKVIGGLCVEDVWYFHQCIGKGIRCADMSTKEDVVVTAGATNSKLNRLDYELSTRSLRIRDYPARKFISKLLCDGNKYEKFPILFVDSSIAIAALRDAGGRALYIVKFYDYALLYVESRTDIYDLLQSVLEFYFPDGKRTILYAYKDECARHLRTEAEYIVNP